jgi:Tfp pilus assembly protein PilF
VVHHAAAALTLRPDHLPAQALRMRGLAATGRLSQAYDIARELIETPLREIDLRLLADTGVLADAAGDHEAAIGYLEQYLRRRPFSPRQWGMLALARKNAGRFQEAALARDQQRLARQNIARLMEREALLASRMGRDEAAERIREDLARMFPERSELAERSRGASTPAE